MPGRLTFSLTEGPLGCVRCTSPQGQWPGSSAVQKEGKSHHMRAVGVEWHATILEVGMAVLEFVFCSPKPSASAVLHFHPAKWALLPLRTV